MSKEPAPIWETLVEIGKSEPSGVWASVPDSTATTQELTAALARAHRFAIVIADRTAKLAVQAAEVAAKAHSTFAVGDIEATGKVRNLLEDLTWAADRAADEAQFVADEAKTVVELAAKWETK